MSWVPWMLRVLRVQPARARVGREGCSRFRRQRGEREPREQQMVLCRQQEPTAPPHPKSRLAHAQPGLPARVVGSPGPTRRSPPGWQHGVAQGDVGMAGRVPGLWGGWCWGRRAGGCRHQGMGQPRDSAGLLCQRCQGSVQGSAWCWWQQCMVPVAACCADAAAYAVQCAGGSSALVAVCHASGSNAWCWWQQCIGGSVLCWWQQCMVLVAVCHASNSNALVAVCRADGSRVCRAGQFRGPCEGQQRPSRAAPDGPVGCIARG